MTPSGIRFMRPTDWTPVTIPPGRYGNPTSLVGYRMSDGTGGNPLHPTVPSDDFESLLAEEMRHLRSLFPSIEIARHHLRMVYRPPEEQRLPTGYEFVTAPRRLTTTSVTVLTLPQEAIADGDLGYCFSGATLPTLRERLRRHPFRGLVGNLGYYMTAGLVDTAFPWSHNSRYPRFPLPTVRAYVGFHLRRDEDGRPESGFLGAHPAAVAVRHDGTIEILPRLSIPAYRVRLGGREFDVRSVNVLAAQDDVLLFTPGLWTPEIRAHEENWQTYAPLLPLAGRINLFIANEGNGRYPVERVIAVWEGMAPLPSFGAVLSFADRVLGVREARSLVGRRVHIRPLGGSDFTPYRRVMGGLVPLVAAGEHLFCVETTSQLIARLREYGATSPIARCGRESDNFAPRVREPAGVLLQTDRRVGWVLCDGRHEMSIGADIADVARIVRLLEKNGAFGGAVRAAVLLDGGSAMKVYGVESDGSRVKLHLLNRVAPGSRNGPGADGEGLNLYSVLRLHL